LIQRETILEARAEADRLHSRLGSKAAVEGMGGGIDVFGAIKARSVELLFRPLDKLLGAYLPPPEEGIIVTSERSLAIQRFTGAHELGHHILGHHVSFDTYEILDRSPVGRKNYDLSEMAADAFAAEFLLPDWVFGIHAERQG
jgi:Zn-dependent peptidase ImmA (M78 family)